MEKKKLKLSISGKSKKTIDNIELAKSQGKNSVIIEKKNTKFGIKPSFNKSNFNRNSFNKSKPNTSYKENTFAKPSITNDFEKRKLAEQRATKRLKGENVQKNKSKIGQKKRELKLTVSRALSDEEIGFKGRSLASLKRAKQKENKEQTKSQVPRS